MAGGRPTKYKEEYCDLIIEFMKDGSSKTQFCAEVGICYDTLLDWQEANPEFSEAVKKADTACQAWWERKGTKAVFGEIEGFNATSYIFNMKNRFPQHYADRKELDHVSSDGSMSQKPTTIQLVAPDDSSAD